ncbi:hypothetical protein IKE86_02565 [Candidatus Saccharibacteria bacterium]|nr:hypothetical protein [Candidatus Saccharibacteria bacterium]
MDFFDILTGICLLIIFCICYLIIIPFYLAESLIDHFHRPDPVAEKAKYYQRYF